MWRNGRTKPAGPPALVQEPTRPPQVLDWSELVMADPPEVPWRIEHYLAEQRIGMLIGDFGFRKSWLAYDLAISVVRAEPVWGVFSVPAATPVLVLDAENGRAEVSRRLSMLAKGRGVDGRLPVFACCDANYRLEDPVSVAELGKLVNTYTPAVVIFDSLRRFHDGDENSSRDMARVTVGLRALIAESGASLLLLYHPRKLSMVSNQAREMIRGSKEVPAGLDSVAFIRKTADGVLVIECTKARHSAEWPSFALRMDEDKEGGVTFTNLGNATEVEDKLSQAEGAIIQTVTAAGGRLDRPSILEACQRDGLKRRTAAEALSRLKKSGQLQEAGKQGRRQVYALAEEALL